MKLDGDFADAEVEGDLLVQPAGGHFPQYLALTRGEQRDLAQVFLHDARPRPLMDIALDAAATASSSV